MFFLFLCILWIHYIIINFLGFKKNIVIIGQKHIIVRIVQLFIAIVFSFSVGYYYLQLFSNNSAFTGMNRIESPNPILEPLEEMDYLEHLLLVPPANTLVDCVYYSVVTITTLGYGDIRPSTNLAKIISIVEVLAGLIIVVLALGSVVGNRSSGSGPVNNQANNFDSKH